jgi:hypothetical protein
MKEYLPTSTLFWVLHIACSGDPLKSDGSAKTDHRHAWAMIGKEERETGAKWWKIHTRCKQKPWRSVVVWWPRSSIPTFGALLFIEVQKHWKQCPFDHLHNCPTVYFADSSSLSPLWGPAAWTSYANRRFRIKSSIDFLPLSKVHAALWWRSVIFPFLSSYSPLMLMEVCYLPSFLGLHGPLPFMVLGARSAVDWIISIAPLLTPAPPRHQKVCRPLEFVDFSQRIAWRAVRWVLMNI